MSEIHDCVVVGAGPAGLTAAIYLGRFRRPTLVIDAGDPRAGWIPTSHNHPGFPQGINGGELIGLMQGQARIYDADIREGEVTGLRRDEASEEFTLASTLGEIRTRNVILATGVKDVEPDISGLYAATQRGVVRWCPICDAYEVTGKRVAVIGRDQHAAREIDFLRTYTDRLGLILIDGGRLEEGRAEELTASGVDVIACDAADVVLEADYARVQADGGERRFDSIYPALGLQPRSKLAHDAGAKLGPDDRLVVSPHMMTSVIGLYAAGDMVRGLNQISIAQAEGAIAATDIHNRLRRLDKVGQRAAA